MARRPGQPTLAALSEASRAEAHRRWLVLRMHVEDGVPLTRVAAASGIPYRTLQRWLARYQAGGMAGLVRAARADRGRSAFPEPLRLLRATTPPGRCPAPASSDCCRAATSRCGGRRCGGCCTRRPPAPARSSPSTSRTSTSSSAARPSGPRAATPSSSTGTPAPRTGRGRLGYDRARILFKKHTGGLDLHQLRHSAATHLGDQKVPLQLITAKTRHKSPRTVMRYVKPGDEAVAEVTSLLGPPRRSH
jgi:hypothetical protein